MPPAPPLLPPPRLRRPLLLVLLACFWGGWLYGALYYAGGVAWAASVAHAGPLFVPLTALLLLLAADSRGEQLWLLLCALGGYLIELLGTATGWPFSAYSYTDALGVKLAGVPLSIAAAWLVLCGFTRALLRGRLAPRPAWRWLAAAALWLTLVDLVIDPVAAGPLHDWVWARPGPYYGVPLQNFSGWFITGVLLCLPGLWLLPEHAPGDEVRAAGRGWVEQPGHVALLCGIAVVALYSLIALAHGLLWPAVLGAALTGISVWTLARG